MDHLAIVSSTPSRPRSSFARLHIFIFIKPISRSPPRRPHAARSPHAIHPTSVLPLRCPGHPSTHCLHDPSLTSAASLSVDLFLALFSRLQSRPPVFFYAFSQCVIRSSAIYVPVIGSLSCAAAAASVVVWRGEILQLLHNIECISSLNYNLHISLTVPRCCPRQILSGRRDHTIQRRIMR